MSLKMNLGAIVLITFMMVFYVSCKDAKARHEVVLSLVGNSATLPIPKQNVQLSHVRWSKNNLLAIQRKQNIVMKPINDRFTISPDGSLQIAKLVKSDEAIYRAECFDTNGNLILDIYVELQVLEPLPQPQLNANCNTKTLICEVTSNSVVNPEFTLFQNEKEVKRETPPDKNSGIWTVRYKPIFFSGKFKCKVNNTLSNNNIEKDINCSKTDTPGMKLYVIFCIAGGLVVLVIAIAVLIYCIRKKRAKRLEREDQERELRTRIAEEGVKYKKLPQPPAQATPTNKNPQRPLPPLPKPQPRPRPHQKAPQPGREVS